MVLKCLKKWDSILSFYRESFQKEIFRELKKRQTLILKYSATVHFVYVTADNVIFQASSEREAETEADVHSPADLFMNTVLKKDISFLEKIYH